MFPLVAGECMAGAIITAMCLLAPYLYLRLSTGGGLAAWFIKRKIAEGKEKCAQGFGMKKNKFTLKNGRTCVYWERPADPNAEAQAPLVWFLGLGADGRLNALEIPRLNIPAGVRIVFIATTRMDENREDIGEDANKLPKIAYSMMDVCGVLMETIEHANLKEPFDVIGLSWGGLLIMMMAKKYQLKIRRAVIGCPSVPHLAMRPEIMDSIFNSPDKMFPTTHKEVDILFDRLGWDKNPSKFAAHCVREMVIANNRTLDIEFLIAQLKGQIKASKEEWEKAYRFLYEKPLTFPVLLCWGEKDGFNDIKAHREIIDRILGGDRNCKFNQVDGVGHSKCFTGSSTEKITDFLYGSQK
eukprot:gnl/MRDRNA2_/MRDRNA2_85635_c0_seq2.p1 gnl/MRDRNA2_/MRDRNA2_85635_c0~~gnl/MRDRNA2_/MRDRNA2_85635_c0_seq2.p1  ORF type:complete len:355 (+),score=61.35 gnl/MRDRNA2_/MRDRNA2_85635_c0_seq2:64-1128(+)